MKKSPTAQTPPQVRAPFSSLSNSFVSLNALPSPTAPYLLEEIHVKESSPSTMACRFTPQQSCRSHRITFLSSFEVVFTRSEEHTSELQSLMRISYAVFCLKKKNKNTHNTVI